MLSAIRGREAVPERRVVRESLSADGWAPENKGETREGWTEEAWCSAHKGLLRTEVRSSVWTRSTTGEQ